MGDYEIRILLIELLLAQSNQKPGKILEEVAVSKGSVRADVVYAHKKLDCYEIKSEADSLKRLSNQGWHYGRAFNSITLVAASKHIDASEELNPGWWGIIEVKNGGKLWSRREAKQNPDQITFGLSELLTKEEALSVLGEVKHGKNYRRKSTKVMHEMVSELYDLEILNNKVLSLFKIRNQSQKLSPPLYY